MVMRILIASSNSITILAHLLTAVAPVHTGKSTEYKCHIVSLGVLFLVRSRKQQNIYWEDRKVVGPNEMHVVHYRTICVMSSIRWPSDTRVGRFVTFCEIIHASCMSVSLRCSYLNSGLGVLAPAMGCVLMYRLTRAPPRRPCRHSYTRCNMVAPLCQQE